jgi:hypothetical protein
MVQIFISYRRDDTAGYARAVYDELARRYGAERVFIDVDDIAAGQSFAEVIRGAVSASSVVLVLIGKRWRGDRDGAASRLDDPGDFVRIEVAAALASGAPVIPVLLDGVPMPSEAELPEALRSLASRNAIELRATAFGADMARLMAALPAAVRDAAQPASAAPATPSAAAVRAPRTLIWGAVAVVAAAAAAWLLWGTPAQQRPSTRLPEAAAPAVVRPDINGVWEADVKYDWTPTPRKERFEFSGSGAGVTGSASFLGVPRGVLEGRADATGLRFVTRTSETTGSGDATRELVHRYQAQNVGGELRFVMQTEGGAAPRTPVSFVARRVNAAR